MNTEDNSDTLLVRRSRRVEESNDGSMFAAPTYLSVDQKTDCGSTSLLEDKQYWCKQWVIAHREGNVSEEKKYVAKKKCVVMNCSDEGSSFESSLDLNNLKESKKRRPRKKKLDLDNVKMNFICGWELCKYDSLSIKDYFYHVSQHVDHLWTEEWQSNKEKWFTCLWNKCPFQSNCEVKSTTHVNYHAYHTRLKCVGAAVLNILEIPECKQNDDGSNILPDLPDEFQCNWENCNERFECMQHYAYHVSRHLNVVEFHKQDVTCPWTIYDCALQFTKRSRLVDHIRSHTLEKMCACPNCGVMFSTYTKLKDHCWQSNKDKSNHQCTLCQKTFSCERLLKQHVRLHINYFKCPQCDASFSRATQLATHTRYRHIDVKPFKCHLCTSQFVREQDLTTHLRKHEPGPLFKCSKTGCDFSCRSEYAIRKHIGMEHYEGGAEGLYKYYCHLCDDLFMRGSFLTKHLKNDHNFHKPAGLKRFRYIEDDDGYYKLQMSRYECLDIQEQKKIKLVDPKNVVVKKKLPATSSDNKQPLEFVVDIINDGSDDEDNEDDI